MRKWTDFSPFRFSTIQRKKQTYADCIITLDTEATSYFLVNGEWVTDDGEHDLTAATDRRAVLYIWSMTINGISYFGRTLNELREFLIQFSRQLGGVTAVVFVHNLGYDFEFFSHLFSDWEVFARKSHRPIYVRQPALNLEFRCSLFLTGMPLAKIAKSLNVEHQKRAGDLNYGTARLPCTPLTPREMGYVEFDVLCLHDIIARYAQKYGNVVNIPLTQTGEVRRVVKKEILNNFNHLQKMKEVSRDFDVYKHLTRLFAGGVTHLNYLYNDEIVENVSSFDRRSSYPAVMCLEQYPLGKFAKYDGKISDSPDFFAYFGLLKIKNLKSKTAWDYISVSKCEKIIKGLSDNGKLFAADYAEIWVTDVDFEIIRDVYTGVFEMTNLYRAPKKFLPLKFVNFILELYANKTELKNVAGREDDYAKSKQFINSLYGMTVTNNIRDEVTFINNEWGETVLSDEDIEQRLNDEKPFLPFAVGVWVTAFARRELFKIVNKVGNAAVYVDTDSVKNVGDISEIIAEYNRELFTKIDTVCNVRGLDKRLFFPVAPDGTVCPLGEFASEGVYERFKSLGAKKYCYEQNGEFHAVIAGCAKKWTEFRADGTTAEHAVIKSIDEFCKGAVYEHGRNVHWYLPNQPATTLTDFLGNEWTTAGGEGGVCIANSTYTVGLSADYAEFLRGVQSTHNKFTSFTRMKL